METFLTKIWDGVPNAAGLVVAALVGALSAAFVVQDDIDRLADGVGGMRDTQVSMLEDLAYIKGRLDGKPQVAATE
ncbi:MAG: hypothetical protein ISN28_04365 [Ectothiorhodospiraceae bacterium AqS1]|nr:hypothetical protein [Ectothiorhodospiraceae bacterium AqS1]